MKANESTRKKAPSDTDQSVPLQAHVDDAERILHQVAETDHGDELDYRMCRNRDSRGNPFARADEQDRHRYDRTKGPDRYDWTRSTEVAPGRREGETLAAQEERHGRQAELDRYSHRARAAHANDVDREASARQLTDAETERPDNFDHDDPRADMDEETLAKVNQQAASIAAQTNMTRAAASRRIADHMDDGVGVAEAAFSAQLDAKAAMDAPTPIGDVSPYWQETTIEGTVTHIIENPASYNQYQVCYVEDDAGTSAKVTIWSKSIFGGEMVRTLREGDRVRISGGKPDEYDGLTTVAVTGDTTMLFLERGEGPAPTGEGRSSFGCHGNAGRT
jgi:hypothetical protein